MHWWASLGDRINLRLPLNAPISSKIFFRLVEVLFYFSCFPSCLIPIWIPGESWREILNEPEVASDIDWKHPQPELTKQSRNKIESEQGLDFFRKEISLRGGEEEHVREVHGEGRGGEYLEKDNIWSTEEIKQTTWQIRKSHQSYCTKQKI